MGKHNGKARKTGLSVGSAIVNRARRDGRVGTAAAYLHTTDTASNKNNMQSVLESNDLEEMMSMVRLVGLVGPVGHSGAGIGCSPLMFSMQASLAGKDFTAEKQHVIVISTGAVEAVDQERVAAERTEAEQRNRHRCA